MEWKSKKDLIKLRRNYNENEDRSRETGFRRDTSGYRETINIDTDGERNIKRNYKPKGRELLQTTDSVTTDQDSGKSGEEKLEL